MFGSLILVFLNFFFNEFIFTHVQAQARTVLASLRCKENQCRTSPELGLTIAVLWVRAAREGQQHGVVASLCLLTVFINYMMGNVVESSSKWFSL